MSSAHGLAVQRGPALPRAAPAALECAAQPPPQLDWGAHGRRWAIAFMARMTGETALADAIRHAATPVAGRRPVFMATGPHCASAMSWAAVGRCSLGMVGVRQRCLDPLGRAGEEAHQEQFSPHRQELGGGPQLL